MASASPENRRPSARRARGGKRARRAKATQAPVLIRKRFFYAGSGAGVEQIASLAEFAENHIQDWDAALGSVLRLLTDGTDSNHDEREGVMEDYELADRDALIAAVRSELDSTPELADGLDDPDRATLAELIYDPQTPVVRVDYDGPGEDPELLTVEQVMSGGVCGPEFGWITLHELAEHGYGIEEPGQADHWTLIGRRDELAAQMRAFWRAHPQAAEQLTGEGLQPPPQA